MSAVGKNQSNWASICERPLDSKYEKCRHITEEIYKRIDITFQIKKLEAGLSDLSDNSEQIDSNELSNETDLFACDKSDISSSTGAEKPPTDCVKFININNNEEKKKPACKRPKKRFRKRVKKRQTRKASDSEGSSDEAPLSRVAVTRDASSPHSPDTCMGVPNIVIITTDKKQKPQERVQSKKKTKESTIDVERNTDNKYKTIDKDAMELKSCLL